MVSFQDIQTIYDDVPLDRIVRNYNRRQRQAINDNIEQFNLFLAKFNQILNDKRIIPFYRNVMHEILLYISKHGFDDTLVHYFNVLTELSKPQTTDRDILCSLDWQMEQAMHKSYNEYSYEEKLLLIFHIIFGKFDKRVQKSFYRLLKKFNFNSRMDLLVFMSSLRQYHNGEISIEQLEKGLETLVSINGIKNINDKETVIDTDFGTIPLSYASDCLGITDMEKLQVGQCHFLVSEYLKEFPNMSGGYYYIPNYFKGEIEHSVLIDYDQGYVYDLSHNIALPLTYFRRYYNSPKFSISGEEFRELSDKVREEYDYTLYMHHLEEVDRELKMIK